MDNSKICTKCLQLKPYSEYYKHSGMKKDGLRPSCKVCDKNKVPAIKTDFIIPKDKRCIKCEVVKPLNEFYEHKETLDKRRSTCILCLKSRIKTQEEILNGTK